MGVQSSRGLAVSWAHLASAWTSVVEGCPWKGGTGTTTVAAGSAAKKALLSNCSLKMTATKQYLLSATVQASSLLDTSAGLLIDASRSEEWQWQKEGSARQLILARASC